MKFRRNNLLLISVYSIGVGGALVLAIAVVFMGWFMKAINIQLRGATYMSTIAMIGIILSVAGMMPWKCEQPQLAGSTDVTTFE